MATFKHDVTGAVCSYRPGSVLHTILSRTEGWSPIEDADTEPKPDEETGSDHDAKEEGESGDEGTADSGRGGSGKKSGRG